MGTAARTRLHAALRQAAGVLAMGAGFLLVPTMAEPAVFPCTEAGILAAIAAGGGPHTFDCAGPTTVSTSAEILIDRDVILDGEGDLTVDGQDAHRVFSVPSGVTVTLANLGVTGGATNSGGGGISNSGALSLSQVRIHGNAVVCNRGGCPRGSGVFSDGTLQVVRSSVFDNPSDGILVGTLAVEGGSATITNSTIQSAGFEGGIVSFVSLKLGSIRVTNTTAIGEAALVGTIQLRDSIVGGCFLSVDSLGGNLESPGDTCALDHPTDQVNVSAAALALGPLQDHGGPTPTMALLPGSIAIDAIPAVDCTWDHDGDPGTAEVRLWHDQRGALRTAGSGCDIGAFEVTECSDTVDNDLDGGTDVADLGCLDGRGATESPQCQDGLNNDAAQDALIDFDGGASLNGGIPLTSPDPQCVGTPWKNKERTGCGLGFELALVLPALAWAHQRRRQAHG